MKYSEYKTKHELGNMAIATEVYMSVLTAPVGTPEDLATFNETTVSDMIDDWWGDLKGDDEDAGTEWNTEVAELYLALDNGGAMDEQEDECVTAILGGNPFKQNPRAACTLLMEVWGYGTEYAGAVEQYDAAQETAEQADLLAQIATEVKSDSLRSILTKLVRRNA